MDGSRWRDALTTLSVVSLPVAILTWGLGMASSTLELTGFGLVTGLHPLWYVGTLGGVAGMLLGIATRRHSVLLMAYVLAIVVMLSATGVLLERSPRFPYIFDSYAFGDQILRTGAIDYSQVYISWPGWHLVTAVAVGASRIDPTFLLTWAPLWLLLVTLAALFTLFRRYRLPRYQRWVSILLAATLFLGPIYPVPASQALILAIYAVALLVEAFLRGNRTIRSRLGLLLLLAALIPMHLLTSIVGILVIGATSLLVAVVLRLRTGPVAMLGVVLLTGYLFYIASQVTAQLLPSQVETAMNLDRLFGSIAGSTASAIGSGSDEHVQVVRVRIGYVAGLATLGFLGVVAAVVRRMTLKRWILPAGWSAGGLGSLGVGGYGGEILGRGSTLAAPGSLAMASWLARVRIGRLALAAAMFTGVIFSPIFIYGNEILDYVRPTELAADAVLESRHPAAWTLARQSRTWYGEIAQSAGGPSVTVYGPLYDVTSAHIGTPDRPPMPFWSYDNGDVRIMVAAAAQ
jgi:hypothetical protein